MSNHVATAASHGHLALQIWAGLTDAIQRYIASVQRSAHSVASHHYHCTARH